MLRDGDAGRRLAPTFAGIRVVFHPRTQSLPQGVSNVVSNVVSNLVSSVVSNLDAQCDAQLGVQWPNKRCPRILWHVVFAIEGMSVVPSFRKVLANDTGVAENASSVWVSLRLAGIFFVQLMRTGVKCGPLDVFRARFGLPRAAGRGGSTSHPYPRSALNLC